MRPAPAIPSGSNMNTPYLFVYGTLMRTARGAMGQPQRRRLTTETAASLGPAKISGLLYDLGSYPGLIPSPSASDFVYGEILELASPWRTLQWLDLYEGINTPPRNTADEYRREIKEVTCRTTGRLAAWVYIYQGSVDPHLRVTSGNWLDRVGHSDAPW